MSDRPLEQVPAADGAILTTVRVEPVQYPALIAGQSSLYIPSVERRCQVLAEQGLLE